MRTTIAIIDDREDVRRAVVTTLQDAIDNQELGDKWCILESPPLTATDEYVAWVNQKNVGVFIIDERLNEMPIDGRTATYLGSDVVKQLRAEHKDLPIYGMTSYTPAEALRQNFGLFDDIIRRDELTAQASSYLQRFLRAHESFLNANQADLAELSTLSQKIASGKANDDEIDRAKTIQEGLLLPLTSANMASRSDWMDEYETIVDQLEKTEREVAAFLKNHPDHAEESDT